MIVYVYIIYTSMIVYVYMYILFIILYTYCAQVPYIIMMLFSCLAFQPWPPTYSRSAACATRVARSLGVPSSATKHRQRWAQLPRTRLNPIPYHKIRRWRQTMPNLYQDGNTFLYFFNLSQGADRIQQFGAAKLNCSTSWQGLIQWFGQGLASSIILHPNSNLSALGEGTNFQEHS
jgi:hypothetical protein